MTRLYRYLERPLIRAAAALALMFALLSPDASAQIQQQQQQQQQAAEPEPVRGKVVSVGKKGRIPLLTVETDSGEQEILITPKVDFSITAPGDETFVVPGLYVTGKAVESNKMYFAKEITVHVGQKGRSGMAKAPAAVGESVNSYLIAGEIAARQQSEEYPEYEVILLKIGRGQPVFLEKDLEVTVSLNDPEQIPEDAAVELHGRLLKNGTMIVQKATVVLTEPLKAEDVLPKAEEKRSR